MWPTASETATAQLASNRQLTAGASTSTIVSGPAAAAAGARPSATAMPMSAFLVGIVRVSRERSGTRLCDDPAPRKVAAAVAPGPRGLRVRLSGNCNKPPDHPHDRFRRGPVPAMVPVGGKGRQTDRTMRFGTSPLLEQHRVFRSRSADETRAFLHGKQFDFDIACREVAGLDARLNGIYLPGMYLGYLHPGIRAALRL